VNFESQRLDFVFYGKSFHRKFQVSSNPTHPYEAGLHAFADSGCGNFFSFICNPVGGAMKTGNEKNLFSEKEFKGKR